MTVILRDASGKMHHGILFDHRLFLSLSLMDQFDYAWIQRTLTRASKGTSTTRRISMKLKLNSAGENILHLLMPSQGIGW